MTTSPPFDEPLDSARESLRTGLGDAPAPPLPTDQDWINTSRPLTSEDVRGRLLILHFWTYA